MTIKEFANLFDNPCSIEDLFSRQKELSECDFIDNNILDGLLNTLRGEKKKLIDRQVLTRAIVTYIVTTGDFSYFIRYLLRELLIKDGCSKEAITQILMQANEQAGNARKRNREKELAEKKKKEDALKRLEESLDMSKTVVSYDTARFLIRNGTTYEELEKSISFSISSQEDIDPILYKYRIGSDGEEEIVSIADVVGYDYSYYTCGNDLLKAFPTFFDSSKRDGYRRRSLSMLDLTTEDGMDVLSSSFREEPIKLADAPGGKYTINGNGMHRYSVLRSLYLIEISRANGNKEQEQVLRDKYRIPALVSKIDYVKTYSNFILSTLKVVNWVSNERDDRNNLTGRARLELKNGEILFLTNEELIAYVGNSIRQHKDDYMVQVWTSETDTIFSKYLEQIVPEMFEYQMSDWEEENAKSI